MVTFNPLFLITKLPANIRMFITMCIIAGYGLFLYELLPEYLFNFVYSLYYFIAPIALVGGILIALPKVLAKKNPNQQPQEIHTQESSEPQIETIPLDNPNQDTIIPNNATIIPNNATPQGVIPDIIVPSPAMSNEVMPQVIMQAPQVDESVLNDMVARAVEPIQREAGKVQDTIADLRGEINSIKSSIESLTLTFETSLTDLKAFQAELANPLNFMRKYFDSIDIKSLSDPTLPLHVEHLPLNSEPSQEPELPPSFRGDAPEIQNKKDEEVIVKTTLVKEPISEDTPRQDISETLPFGQMLNGSLTLGKLMTTVSVLEEILQTIDRDSIDVLIDQCKMMGLKQEDEHIIYNIINMMDKSGLSVNEILVMLYKFGKVMGINDKEADLVYTKLLVNHSKNQGSLVTVESKKGS